MPPLGDYPENDCSCHQRAEEPDAAVAPGEPTPCDELSETGGLEEQTSFSRSCSKKIHTVTALPLAFVTSKGKFATGLLPSITSFFLLLFF